MCWETGGRIVEVKSRIEEGSGIDATAGGNEGTGLLQVKTQLGVFVPLSLCSHLSFWSTC